MIIKQLYKELPFEIQEIKNFLKIENNLEDKLLEDILKSVDNFIQSRFCFSISKKEITFSFYSKVNQKKRIKIYPVLGLIDYKLNGYEKNEDELSFIIEQFEISFFIQKGKNEITIETQKLINEDIKFRILQHIGILYENRENMNQDLINSINSIYSDYKNIRLC